MDKLKLKSYEQFLTFLYVCIAKADYKLVDEEIEAILLKIQRFKSEKEAHEILKETLHIYSRLSDKEIQNAIENCAEEFSAQLHKSKGEIYEDLQHVMEADGMIRDVEMMMLRIIKKILS